MPYFKFFILLLLAAWLPFLAVAADKYQNAAVQAAQ